MDTYPRLGFLLSLALVLSAALFLHPGRSDPGPSLLAGPLDPHPVEPGAIPEPTRGEPWGTIPVPVAQDPPTPPSEANGAGDRVAIANAAAPEDAPPPMPPRAVSRRRPHSALVEVEQGENLEAVALRVYGDSQAKLRIWEANRDRLAQPDTPLVAGMYLRTP